MSKAAPASRTLLLVGGGSGGHIYPNLAVVERLREMGLLEKITPHLVVSQRPLDAQIAEASGLGFAAIPAAPLSVRPKGLLRFWREYQRGVAATTKLIEQTHATAMIATGGFVSGPAVAAARRAKIPVALMSLDAVPGRANRFAAKKATAVFSAFPTHQGARALKCPGHSRDAEVIGFPLRRAAVAPPPPGVSQAIAREYFGLDPDRKTLLVFAGSQGARTINQAMELLYHQGDDFWIKGFREQGGDFRGRERNEDFRERSENFRGGWQVLHVTGPGGDEGTRPGTEVPGPRGRVLVKVLSFCDRMDLAWRAADVALTRAGAGTVAEAWANAVPSVMLPYPFHKDEHQKHNAAPLVALGGAVVLKDMIVPAANAQRLGETLGPLLQNESKRAAMRQALRDHPPQDGAERLAEWVASLAM